MAGETFRLPAKISDVRPLFPTIAAKSLCVSPRCATTSRNRSFGGSAGSE
jgi:hypothetical protein